MPVRPRQEAGADANVGFRPIADLRTDDTVALQPDDFAMRRALRVVGYLLFALAVVGLCLRLTMAAGTGRPFAGQNAYHLPIPTYSTIAVIVLAAAIGAYALFRRLFRRR